MKSCEKLVNSYLKVTFYAHSTQFVTQYTTYLRHLPTYLQPGDAHGTGALARRNKRQLIHHEIHKGRGVIPLSVLKSSVQSFSSCATERASCP